MHAALRAYDEKMSCYNADKPATTVALVTLIRQSLAYSHAYHQLQHKS